MNFVILDLEWDSAYFVKEHRFINQIIQIGAVKLNYNLEIVDSFQKEQINPFTYGRKSFLWVHNFHLSFIG